MINSKKRIIVMLSFLAFLFIFVMGISYAYYATEIKGNTSENPSLKLTSGYLAITYEGNSSSIAGGSTQGITDDLVYTKNFTVKNSGVADSYFGIRITDYKITDESGNETTLERPQDWTYELKSGSEIITSGVFPTEDAEIIPAYPISVNETKNLTLTVTFNYITEEEASELGLSLAEINQTADMGKILSFGIAVTQSLSTLESAKEGTLLYAINKDNVVSEPLTTPGRASSLDNEAVLAAANDDYGTSFYFRGNVQNNFITYSNMCWRIVRVQGDGTIKLALADRDNPCGTANGYSLDDDDGAFVTDKSIGFFYKGFYANAANSGHSISDFEYSDSDMATALEDWAWIDETSERIYKYYDKTGSTYQSSKFTNAALDKTWLTQNPAWCIDISISDYSDFYTRFGSYGRLKDIATATPTLKCNMKGYKEETSYKYTETAIGMLTADELAFAGSVFGLESNYYLKSNTGSQWYYSLSPYLLIDSFAMLMFSNPNGDLNESGSGEAGGLRPAIILKSDVTLSTDTDYVQDGTIDKPYVIS